MSVFDAYGSDIREGVKKFSDWPTIPQVCIFGYVVCGLFDFGCSYILVVSLLAAVTLFWDCIRTMNFKRYVYMAIGARTAR